MNARAQAAMELAQETIPTNVLVEAFECVAVRVKWFLARSYDVPRKTQDAYNQLFHRLCARLGVDAAQAADAKVFAGQDAKDNRRIAAARALRSAE